MHDPQESQPPRLKARVQLSELVQIRLTLSDEHLEPDWLPVSHARPEYLRTWAGCLGTVPVTAWVNDTALCTQLLRPEQARALLGAGLFARPTFVMAAAGINHPDPAYFKTDFHAVLDDPSDFMHGRLLFQEKGHGVVRVELLPLRGTGLWLGHRWCPTTWSTLCNRARFDWDVDLWAFEADRAFSYMMFPDPAEAAARLLRSVEGIGGEVAP